MMLLVTWATWGSPRRCGHSDRPTRITVPLPSCSAVSAGRSSRAGLPRSAAAVSARSAAGRPGQRLACAAAPGGLLEPREAGQPFARAGHQPVGRLAVDLAERRRRAAVRGLPRRAPNGSVALGCVGRLSVPASSASRTRASRRGAACPRRRWPPARRPRRSGAAAGQRARHPALRPGEQHARAVGRARVGDWSRSRSLVRS